MLKKSKKAVLIPASLALAAIAAAILLLLRPALQADDEWKEYRSLLNGGERLEVIRHCNN